MRLKELHVVIIGVGFAGLNVAKLLASCAKYKVTLIDKTNHHLFQPLLYQVATAALSPADIAIPIREIFRYYPRIETLMGTVIKIDKERKNITLEDGQLIDFDYLIICPGASHSYFGKNQWEPYAPGLKTLEDAVLIREKILSSFELAERTKELPDRQRLMTFVIVGGGPTGIEMAGAIAEIAHQTLKNNFRHIDLNQTKIYLVESGGQLLTGYPSSLTQRGQRDLEQKGVTVMLNKLATDITAEGVWVGQEFIPAANVIWAAGNEASNLLKTLNVPLDRQGRVFVESDLTLKDFNHIFVLGDAAHFKNAQGLVLPAVAPVAVQQGRYVANRLKNDKLKYKAFTYKDRGMMATIGKYDALVLSGPFTCTGFLAWLAWCFIHIYFLIGYRTKLFVFMQWGFYFFRGARNIRIIFNPLKMLSKKKQK